jgi:outer membrane protein assembly factor BamB
VKIHLIGGVQTNVVTAAQVLELARDFMTRFACALGWILILVGADLRADNWPHWRGPDNNGVAPTKGLPISWSESKNVAWKVPLPGKAGSTPVVWGDRIFLTSSKGNDFVLLCIRTDGKPLWERPLAKGVEPASKKDEGNEGAASPSTDGKHVYTFHWSGAVACHDFAGHEVWKFNAQKRYVKFEILHGLHSTPLLHEDRLYLALLHGNGHWVIALDKATGKEVWKVQRKTDAVAVSREAYASPCLWHDGKRTSLVVLGCDYATGHRLEDGGEIWRLGDLNPRDNYSTMLQLIASPVATPEMLLVPTAKGGPVVAVKPGARGLIRAGGPFELWRNAKASPRIPSPLVHDRLVYLVREPGLLHCLDAKTGAEVYLQRLHADRYCSSPILAAGRLYLVGHGGTVSVVKAGWRFELLAANTLDDSFTASPAAANGRLYLRGFRSLYAIEEGGKGR